MDQAIGFNQDVLNQMAKDDAHMVQLHEGFSQEEIRIAKNVMQKIAFRSGYGKNTQLCLYANKILQHIQSLESQF